MGPVRPHPRSQRWDTRLDVHTDTQTHIRARTRRGTSVCCPAPSAVPLRRGVLTAPAAATAVLLPVVRVLPLQARRPVRVVRPTRLALPPTHVVHPPSPVPSVPLGSVSGRGTSRSQWSRRFTPRTYSRTSGGKRWCRGSDSGHMSSVR